MKKMKYCFSLLLIAVLCAACQKNIENQEKSNTQVETQSNANEQIKEEDTQQEAPAESEETKEKSITIYYLSDEAEEIIEKTVTVSQIDASTVWQQLAEAGVVPEGSNALSVEQDGEILRLDVDTAFGEYFRQMGTTGERYIIECVSNTFLDAYQSEKMLITENGGTLCSGHKEYREYIEKSR